MDDPQDNQVSVPEPADDASSGEGNGKESTEVQIPTLSAALPTPSYLPSVDNAVVEAEIDCDYLPSETRTQRFTRLLLIIMAVIVTAITLISFSRRVIICISDQSFLAIADDESLSPQLFTAIFPFPWQQVQRHHFEFILYGDTSRLSQAAQRRAIWEAHPNSRTYFANYIAYLEQEKLTTTQSLLHFEQEISCGERLDPQNALYHYLLAAALIDWSVLNADKGPKIDKITGNLSFPYRIRDRHILDRAMREYLIGLGKPYFNTFHLAMVREQIGALPPCRQLEDQLLKITIAEGTPIPAPIPATTRLPELANVMTYYAQTLMAEGRMQEATPYLESWLPYTKQITASSDSLITLLVARETANIGGECSALLYAAAGREDLANQTRAKLARVISPIDTFRATIKQHPQEYDKLWNKSAGILTGILLPKLGTQHPPTVSELAPTRYVEQQVVEEIWTTLLAGLLCIFMLYTLFITIRWRLILRNTRSVPLLPGLPWREQARIILYAVILPLVLYLVYAHYSGRAGRELKVSHILFRMIVELSVISIVMLVLPGYLARRALRRQYQELGIPIPSPGLEWQARIACGIGAILWVSAFGRLAVIPPVLWIMSTLGNPDLLDSVYPFPFPESVLFLVPIGLLILASLMLVPILWERKRHRYGSYFGTLARTMLPIQAGILLLLLLVIYPACTANERALLRSDRILYYQGQSLGCGMSPLEERVVTRMRTEMLTAINAQR